VEASMEAFGFRVGSHGALPARKRFPLACVWLQTSGRGTMALERWATPRCSPTPNGSDAHVNAAIMPNAQSETKPCSFVRALRICMKHCQ
jgi:hypothetical protein